ALLLCATPAGCALFPYATLFRSEVALGCAEEVGDEARRRRLPVASGHGDDGPAAEPTRRLDLGVDREPLAEGLLHHRDGARHAGRDHEEVGVERARGVAAELVRDAGGVELGGEAVVPRA